jgi:hypothetical protein
LLRDVNRNVARAMVILVAIATAIMCLNLVFEFVSLLVATDPSYAVAFGVAGANALVLLLLDLHHYGFVIAQIFFGLWLVPLGYLAYTSGMFPKALGVVLVIGAGSYLVDLLIALLLPDLSKQVHAPLAIAPTIAEVWTVFYLIVKGVRTPNATEAARIGATTPAVAESPS